MQVAGDRHIIAFLTFAFFSRCRNYIAHLVYPLMYAAPLPLRVLEVFTSDFPYSHLAYAIGFMHSTRADGVCPHSDKFCRKKLSQLLPNLAKLAARRA